MGPLLLVSILGFGMMAVSMNGQTDPSEEDPVANESDQPEQEDILDDEEPVEDVVEEEEVLDTGATAVLSGSVITIDVGDDETGSVVAIRSASDMVLSPACCSGGTDYGVNFYLVPEGLDFPPTPTEVIAENPELDEYGSGQLYYDDYFDNIGLDPIATIDLGVFTSVNWGEDSDPPSIRDTRPADLEIVSNQEFELLGFYTDDNTFIGDRNFAPLDDIADPATAWENEWPTDEEPLETGAAFAFDPTAGTVNIEVGEDETGTLAVVTFLDTQDDSENFIAEFEARYYLVPEGQDLSDYYTDNTYFPDDAYYNLETFEEELGLHLLGTVNLLGTEGDSQALQELPVLTSNQPADYYFLEENTDGDDLIEFRPDAFVGTFNGIIPVDVSINTTGSDVNDWLVTQADGITLDGAGNSDRLESGNTDVTLIGGEGNDQIIAVDALNVSIDGGAGDDEIHFVNGIAQAGDGDDVVHAGGWLSATVSGGQGDDIITISEGLAQGDDGDDRIGHYSLEAATLEGGDGNDTIESGYESGTRALGGAGDDIVRVSGASGFADGGLGNDSVQVNGANSQAFGGEGDDTVTARDGGAAFGEDGNDEILVTRGSSADGGEGDDHIIIRSGLRDSSGIGPAMVTGGEGADTFDAQVWYPIDGEPDTLYTIITDFDPAEDALQVGVAFGDPDGVSVADVEVVEAADGSYSDVRVTFTPYRGDDPGIAVIRLDGTTGISANDIVIVG